MVHAAGWFVHAHLECRLITAWGRYEPRVPSSKICMKNMFSIQGQGLQMWPSGSISFVTKNVCRADPELPGAGRASREEATDSWPGRLPRIKARCVQIPAADVCSRLLFPASRCEIPPRNPVSFAVSGSCLPSRWAITCPELRNWRASQEAGDPPMSVKVLERGDGGKNPCGERQVGE